MKYITTVFMAGLVLLITAGTQFACAEEAATVIYVEGWVKVRHPGSTLWYVVKEGDKIKNKDRLKTVRGASAKISLDSTLKNIVELEEKTEITAEDLKAKKLKLPKGSVLGILEALPEGSSFEVRTPTAVAGVVGSGLGVRTERSRSEVRCFENKAYVRGIDKKGNLMERVNIDEGFKSRVERFERPGRPSPMDRAERARWREFRAETGRQVDIAVKKGIASAPSHGPDGGQKQMGTKASSPITTGQNGNPAPRPPDKSTDTRPIIQTKNRGMAASTSKEGVQTFDKGGADAGHMDDAENRASHDRNRMGGSRGRADKMRDRGEQRERMHDRSEKVQERRDRISETSRDIKQDIKNEDTIIRDRFDKPPPESGSYDSTSDESTYTQ